jgi:ABC-type Fe3+-hydroxamate transport system substrate-binding protein
LVPSLTEAVASIGLGPFLVARTGFCIHPAGLVEGVPKVGGTKDVDLDKLRTLAPTHVLVNVDETRRETVEAIQAWADPPEIVVTHPRDPDDNLALIAQLAATFAPLAERAAVVLEALRDELAATRPEGRPSSSVVYLIWQKPWMTVARDTYLSRMLARIGWSTVPAVEGGYAGVARYPVLVGDEPWLGDVDRVLLSSEPYRFERRHLDAAQALCPGATVRLVDGELLSWYGPRAIAGLRYLRGLAQDEAEG